MKKVPTEHNKTACDLIISIQNGETDELKTYLVGGGNPDLKNDNGLSLFWAALENCNNDAVNLLLDYKMDIESCDKDGIKALRNIVRMGDISSLKKILDAGVDVNAISGKDGKTALYEAIENGFPHELELLVNFKASFEIDFKDGMTPWSKTFINSKEIVMTLLSVGVDPNLTDSLGQNAMHIMAKEGLSQSFEVIAKTNMDVNIPDNDGNTPLHIAVLNGRMKTCVKLLDLGADISLVNKAGLDAYNLLDRDNMWEDEDFQTIGEILTVARKQALQKNLNNGAMGLPRRSTGGKF